MPEDNGDDALLANIAAAAEAEHAEEKPDPTPEEVAEVTKSILVKKESQVPPGVMKADPDEKLPETPTPPRPGDADFVMPITKKEMEKAVCEGKVLFSDIPVNHPYFTG